MTRATAEGAKIAIQLTVSDLGVTEAFYRGILDLPVKRSFPIKGAPEYLQLREGGWEIIFVPEETVIGQHPELKEGLLDFPKGVGLVFHFRVDDIEVVSDALEEEGMEILSPLKAMPYGMKEVWCLDPDGYILALEEPWR